MKVVYVVQVLLFWPALFNTKSSCLALFSALRGAQHCDRRIYLEIKHCEQGLNSHFLARMVLA